MSEDDALRLRRLLKAIVAIALHDADEVTPGLRDEALAAQAAMLAASGNALPPVDLDAQWEHAFMSAEKDAGISDHAGVSLTLPHALPFDAQLLMSQPLDLDLLRQQVRGATATG